MEEGELQRAAFHQTREDDLCRIIFLWGLAPTVWECQLFFSQPVGGRSSDEQIIAEGTGREDTASWRLAL
jgi:hypothetical protein